MYITRRCLHRKFKRVVVTPFKRAFLIPWLLLFKRVDSRTSQPLKRFVYTLGRASFDYSKRLFWFTFGFLFTFQLGAAYMQGLVFTPSQGVIMPFYRSVLFYNESWLPSRLQNDLSPEIELSSNTLEAIQNGACLHEML